MGPPDALQAPPVGLVTVNVAADPSVVPPKPLKVTDDTVPLKDTEGVELSPEPTAEI